MRLRSGWGWAYGEVRAAVHLEVVEQLAQRERVVRGVAPSVHQRHRQLRVRVLAEALAAATAATAAAASAAVALEKGLDLLEGGAVRLAQHAVDLLLELGRADLVRGLRGGRELVGHAWRGAVARWGRIK